MYTLAWSLPTSLNPCLVNIRMLGSLSMPIFARTCRRFKLSSPKSEDYKTFLKRQEKLE